MQPQQLQLGGPFFSVQLQLPILKGDVSTNSFYTKEHLEALFLCRKIPELN